MEKYDIIMNRTIKIFIIVVLIIVVITLLNLNGIFSNSRDVSGEVKDNGKILIREFTESAVEALREHREEKEINK